VLDSKFESQLPSHLRVKVAGKLFPAAFVLPRSVRNGKNIRS
jgi:hypothetical protein